jgi:hypothetical protein
MDAITGDSRRRGRSNREFGNSQGKSRLLPNITNIIGRWGVASFQGRTAL